MTQVNVHRLVGLLNLRAAVVSLIIAIALAIPAIGGTQADFTAVTTNPGNLFSSAVLAITTDHPSGAFVNVGDLVPGDTITRSVTVQNSGSAPFTYMITASSASGPETVLWKNKVKGIQVAVSGDGGPFYSGPISTLIGVPSGIVVPGGGTEVLTYVFSLPNSAGNAFQGQNQGIEIRYDATQLPGLER